MSQTTIQKPDAIRTGSFKLEIGDSIATLVDIGALNNGIFIHKGETVEIELDNVDNIKKLKNNDKYSVTFDMAETDFDNLNDVFSGNWNISSTAGTPVVGATQTALSGSWLFNQFIEIENQNGDGSPISVTTVTGATDGLLVSGTDYFVGTNAEGLDGIFIIDSTTVTTEVQDLDIVYDYTPNASKTLIPVSTGIAPEKVLRITNTDDNGKTFVIEMSGVTSIEAMSMPFPGDGTDDIQQVAAELEGKLVSMVDEQSTT